MEIKDYFLEKHYHRNPRKKQLKKSIIWETVLEALAPAVLLVVMIVIAAFR
jgi:hypothetical protein